MPNALELSATEKTRLSAGLKAAFKVPIIDDVEDFVWEAVFHYVKRIPLYDPYTVGRNKLLFDVVAGDGRGWSLKTLVVNSLKFWSPVRAGTQFEFIIQRADIFRKAKLLGFKGGLHEKSPVNKLGVALIRHWNAKVDKDKKAQKIRDGREAVLLKSQDRKKFVYLENKMDCLNPADFTWAWSEGEDQRGLKGMKNGKVYLKWYFGQKQLFEVRTIPKNAYTFTIDRKLMPLLDFLDLLSRPASTSPAKA